MVRTIVGTLVMVGRGLRKPEWVREVLEARDRTAAGRTPPRAGWCFGRCSTDGGQAGSQAPWAQGGKKASPCEVHPHLYESRDKRLCVFEDEAVT